MPSNFFCSVLQEAAKRLESNSELIFFVVLIVKHVSATTSVFAFTG